MVATLARTCSSGGAARKARQTGRARLRQRRQPRRSARQRRRRRVRRDALRAARVGRGAPAPLRREGPISLSQSCPPRAPEVPTLGAATLGRKPAPGQGVAVSPRKSGQARSRVLITLTGGGRRREYGSLPLRDAPTLDQNQ